MSFLTDLMFRISAKRNDLNASHVRIRGVFYESASRRWVAHVCENGVKRKLGRYTTQAEAETARTEYLTERAAKRR